MNTVHLIFKCILTIVLAVLFPIVSIIMSLILSGCWGVTQLIGLLLLPILIVLIWLPKKKVFWISYAAVVLCFAILVIAENGINNYNASITIDVTPNINIHEYLPFEQRSKIVQIDSKTLDFSELEKAQLPIIDGAAAVFPVYSGFVHAVYPNTTSLYDGVFEYNNTSGGYMLLGEKMTDIFIGAYPSQEQIAYANTKGTTFDYTQIGSEAFVFFVHKDNPIQSLTTEQIKGIYSGEITNWSQVGGNDEKIVPFQRNEGSGSQSMLIRFMGDTPIVEPDTQTTVMFMGGIIEEVADYKNKTSSIGFSFRYYVEGIIQNPDIKMIAIDGIAPTKENIQNASYPIITPLYAVTYKEQPKESVRALIEWMLSEEGQYIIEQTGYVGISQE